MSREAVIIDSVRTGLAKAHRGSFNMTRPDDQLAHCIAQLFARNSSVDKSEVGDVIAGCGLPEGPQGMNVARISTILAGLPASVAATTVNRFCSSGSQAIMMAAQQIIHEGVDIAIGSGVETITMLQDGSQNTKRLLNVAAAKKSPGLYMAMGVTAENVAERYKVSREDQDQYALKSQQRTARAQELGYFDDEIAPMKVRRMVQKKGEEPREEDFVVDRDECNRPDTTIEGLRKLPPSFKPEGGTVTAGNASQLSDGASATLLMSASRANALGLEPMGIYRGSAVAGCEPDEMGIGPIYAVPKLLKRLGMSLDDIDLVELNEAFASQVLQVQRVLGIPDEKLNPNGGSISIGHPFGMTGSRLTGHILRELKRRKKRYGLVTMCVGGGQGFASVFEAV
jgi:acetyl-CoA acetyltransferase family protein